MFWWTIAFFLAALVSGIPGFSGDAGSATMAARMCSVLFLALAVVSFLNRRMHI